MKKGSVKYIVGGSIVGFGVLLIIIAGIFGGWKALREFGGISVDWDGLHYFNSNKKEYILTGENGTMEKGDIKNLNIDVDYGKLIIKTDNVEEIKIDTKNIVTNRFKWEQSGDTLKIKYGGGFSFFTWKTNSEITITFPKDMTFDKAAIKNGAGETCVNNFIASDIKVENGAGALNLTDISAKDKLHLDNGAGAVKMKSINCGKLDLNGGVGEITAEDAVCTELKLDNGIGAFRYEGEINGNADIDNGIGEIRMTVYGKSSEYGFDVDSGIGQVRVNGNTPISYTEGKYKFKIDTGVGEVRIDFKEKN